MLSDSEIDALYDELNAHRRAGRDEAARKTLERIVARVPNEPVPRIALAEHLSLMNLPSEALGLAREALDIAKINGNFIRQATGVLIRAALVVGEYKLVEQLLRELIEYCPDEGSADIAPEFDFVNRLPPQTIPDAIVAQYRAKYASGA